MTRNRHIVIVLSVFMLASCSSVPKPVTHKFSHQTQLEAAEHWGILARDFADDIVAAMVANPLSVQKGRNAPENMYIIPSAAGDDLSVVPSIYIQTNDRSDFGATFSSYLFSELTSLGYPISPTPKGSVSARWSVKKVRHDAERIASGWPATGTTLSLLGYGVYKILDNTSSDFAGYLAGGILYDVLNSGGKYFFPSYVPHTEIVVTFTVSNSEYILYRRTQAYYVNEQDFDHYQEIADFGGKEYNVRPVNFRLVTNN